MRGVVVPKGEKYYFVIISGYLEDGRDSRHYNQCIMCSRLCCGLLIYFYRLIVMWYPFFEF